MYKYEALTAVLQWSGKMVNFFFLRNNASMFQCFLYWMLNGYASLWQRRVCITPHFIASAAEHFRDHCN